MNLEIRSFQESDGELVIGFHDRSVLQISEMETQRNLGARLPGRPFAGASA
jgi:hypothetical protein